MSRYLVTGGAGFVGSNIVHGLVEAGESVRVVDNLSTGFRKNLESVVSQIDYIEGDLLDPEVCAKAVAGMDYVLHQAALPSVPRSVARPRDSHHNNATVTLNLLIAASEASIKRFVYAGSSSVYGNCPEPMKHEDIRPEPLSTYAASKLCAESYVRSFARCHNLPGVVLRYFNVFGPRQNPDSPYSALIPKFIRAALEGIPVEIHGDGLQARDFTFVKNNVYANRLAAEADIPAQGEVYNIAAGQSRTLLEIVEAIEKITGKKLEARHTEPRKGDVRVSHADISRAQKALGYTLQCSFEEGLAQTVAWYKNNI